MRVGPDALPRYGRAAGLADANAAAKSSNVNKQQASKNSKGCVLPGVLGQNSYAGMIT